MLIQKLKLLSLGIFLSFLFNGCSQKDVVFETKLICFEQSIFTKPKLEIFIANEDIENAKSYKEANDSAYKNYEDQVLRNNKRCEEIGENDASSKR